MAIESDTPSTLTTNPGVGVAGGKYCHQCRQKTMDLVASCKATKKNKPCPLKFCQKCLLNRYGENAEEVDTVADWTCPVCRCKCSCSVCRDKQGLAPTGILIHKARANGLASAAELLEVEGHDKFSYQKKPKLDVASMEGTSGNNDSVPETEVAVADVAKETTKVVGKRKRKLKEEIHIDAQLPQGISLTSVSSIDIPTEEAGNVFQFLEFCLVFRQALDLKEGQAETVVRELFSCEGNTKRLSIIEMMIQLLTLIVKNRNMTLSLSATDSNWFTALGACLKKLEVSIDEFPSETFEKGLAEYEKMDASRRLKLLNFLCDESLTTEKMRDYIIGKYREFVKQKKEAKQKAAAAKEKKKQLKQKLKSDVAKAIMEKNGAPLSIEEHNSIRSQLKAEIKEAHDEMMEAKGKTCGNMLRTEPILVDDNGLVLWKLNCYEEEPKFLLQDLGTFGDLCSKEKWLAFKPEQKPEIEKYISSKRMKPHKNAIMEKNTNAEASESVPSSNLNLIISDQCEKIV